MPQAEFDTPGEKWQLSLNIAIDLPPKPPRLDGYTFTLIANFISMQNIDPLKVTAKILKLKLSC